MKHTSAPWTAKQADSNTIVIRGATRTGEPIAKITHPHGDTEALANAEVISLAPDMFEALLSIAHAKHLSTEDLRRAINDKRVQFLLDMIEEIARNQ